MTNLSPQAQSLWDIYCEFDPSSNEDGKKVIAAVLRCLIDKCNEPRGTGRVDKKHCVVSVKTLMKLVEELEKI